MDAPIVRTRRGVARRTLLRATAGAGALLLTGCDKLSESDWFRTLLGIVDGPNRWLQRALGPKDALAR
jgi:hypothetical protein